MRAVLATGVCLLAAGPAAAVADPCGGLVLRDVAVESGIDFLHARGGRGDKHLPETMGAGVAWLDYDGDGRLDLYVVQSGPFPPTRSAEAANRLYRNLGAGRFEDVTEGSGAGDRSYGQGVLAADLDGDGPVDLYLTNYGADVFLRNRGDGTFEDRTSAAGLGTDGWSSSAAAADADGDGDLDLYVARYLEFDPDAAIECSDPESGARRYCDPTLFAGALDVLYENLGDGTFRPSTSVADADGKGLGVVFSDLDGDRRSDIYVANDLTLNLLYLNRGGFEFDQVALLSGAGLNRDGKAEAGMGIGLGDVDGDLDPDLVVSNFDVETNTLYINRGDATFDDRSATSGFGPPSFNLLGFGAALADFDGDGALDAYITNGHIFETPRRDHVAHAQPDLLLLGDGRGGFRRVACGPAFDQRRVGRGLALGDYDDDGDPDLAINNNGGALQLLRNDSPSSDWIGVRLVGPAPNTEAIGALVTLKEGERRRAAWVLAGDSYQSASERRVRFRGVGPAPTRLEVEWPDGGTTTLDDPPRRAYLLASSDGIVLDPAAERAGRLPSLLVAGAVLVVLLLAAGVTWRLVTSRRD